MPRLLIIDDQPELAALLQRVLDQRGWPGDVATSIAEARERLASTTYELALCDLRLGNDSGLTLAEEIRARYPSVAVLFVSAVDDPLVAEEALDLGAYGYLLKPVDTAALVIAVSSALRRREAELLVAEQQEELEDLVRRRSDALFQTIQDQRSQTRRFAASYDDLLRLLGNAAVPVPGVGGGHAERLLRAVRLVAETLSMEDVDIASIASASVLHDVGNLQLPVGILTQPGPLTGEQWSWVRRHPVLGNELLSDCHGPELALAAELALRHHERLDGSGYPYGLSGSELSDAVRLVAVVSAYDAMTSARVHRGAMSSEAAVSELEREAGVAFDREVVRAVRASLSSLQALRRRFPDPVFARPERA